MLVSLQPVGWAGVPLNATELLVSRDGPKFVPVIVTAVPGTPGVPATPCVGFRFVILGAPHTVNAAALVDWPAAVLPTTDPAVAPIGTATSALASLQPA